MSEKLLYLFKIEICDNSKTIDPKEEFDWYALSVGFFLANGADIEQAQNLAHKARYEHKYWR